MRMCHFWAQNSPFFLNKFFLVQTIIITFIYHIGPFQCAEVKKNSYSRSRIVRMWNFWAYNGPFAWSKFFFWKIIPIIFIYLLTLFIFLKFKKKFFQQIQSYEDVQFLGPKWPICPNESFSENLLLLVPFIHASMYMQKIKIRY